ncbi:MAG: 6-carboxytetrahydropterin synthase QueD [Candidatus Omnitrophica bacterium]|nr:6-carboxytetrahydropterin synthase QueD [Candidatus Omnitrophota bacterium]
MYTVRVTGTFSSAHNLLEYEGKCEALHGHNWKVELEAGKKKLDRAGMVMDFHDLKSELGKVLDELDHKYLNELEYFKSVNPTSENIAKYIHDRVIKSFPDMEIVKATVWETESSSATYYK